MDSNQKFKKKIVFLFGAGAALDWGAPLTICCRKDFEFIPEHGSSEVKNRPCCLTHLITSVGYFAKDGERVSKKIFNILTEKNAKGSGSINFETVIDFIEEIYNYISVRNNINSTGPTISAFTDLTDFINNLFHYEIADKTTTTYSLKIPGFECHGEKYISINLPPEQKYCELLLKDLIGSIIGHISKYSYHTHGYNVIYNEKNELLNQAFINWCKKYISDGFLLRMYTLNYDRIFKILLQDQDIDVFEGFDLLSSTVGYVDRLLPNIKRIVSDFNCHSYYNLHGSSNWQLDELNSNQLPGYQFYLTAGPHINNSTAILEIEKHKPILLSNIISGYKKVLKTAISPFRQMLSAFDRDCIEADELFIAGYSNGDEHINDIIRNARKYNINLNITIVTPSFNDEKFMFDFLLHWGSPNGMIYKNDGLFDIISQDYKVRIIQKKFIQFLSEDAYSDRSVQHCI